MRLAVVVAAVLVLPELAGCALLGQGTVTRKVHGRLLEGRFVSDTAYLAYTEGALAESRRELDVAERAYLTAASLDDDSADVWTRVGAVRCARGDQVHGEEAFARARRIDPEWAPLFAERATCLASAGRLDDARSEALRALALEPTREATTLLLASIESRAGRPDEARRWLRGLMARSPGRDDLARALVSGGADIPPGPKRDDPRAKPTRADVDAALSRGDGREARRLAATARIAGGSLAVRAAALGAWEFAREHATLVLDAEPSNAEARVALLAAADALGDAGSRAHATTDVPRRVSHLTGLGALVLGELLARRGLGEAATSVRAAVPSDETADPLVTRLRQRAARDRQ